jgi:hypothetical protein
MISGAQQRWVIKAVSNRMLFYDQPLTQRKLRVIPPRRKWMQFNQEKVESASA